MNENILPVSALVERINYVLGETLDLTGFWIMGEVSGLKKHYSGHWYFTIKDADGAIDCNMWKSYVARLKTPFKEGDQILVTGAVSVYAKSGKLALNVHAAKPYGLGELYQKFEELKQKLEKEGIFSTEHKKSRPQYIQNVGIVTGKSTAALQDILKTIIKRWPLMKIHVYPAMVQGANAPASIRRALKKADEAGHDAIILARGGGSYEDLFCFNDEGLVKDIYNAKTFIVTGIGHETDYTLADYAADHRAVTPTAAAQYVSLDQQEVRAWLNSFQSQITIKMSQILDNAQQQLAYIQSNPYLSNPENYLKSRRSDLAALSYTLESSMVSRMERERSRLNLILASPYMKDPMAYVYDKKMALQADIQKLSTVSFLVEKEQMKVSLQKSALENAIKLKFVQSQNELKSRMALLEAYDPGNVLKRGYAIIEKDGEPVMSVQNLKTNNKISVRMSDGTLSAKVLTVNQEEK